ncbi:MAG: EAL domain-containing protein [Lachnospiraceae bacterium]|nr:EAL domain-containing protein [Lachnospiraceae bacterium]
MWNYSYILPNFFVLLLFLAYFFSRPRLPINRNRIFLVLLIVNLLHLVIDVLSSKADENYYLYPVWLLYLLNMLFFIFFFIQFFTFFLFTLNELHSYDESSFRFNPLFVLAGLISVLVTLSSFFTGAVFYIDSNGYHSGPLYNIIYFCSAFYIILSLVLILIRKNNLQRRKIFALLAYNVTLFMGIIVRRLFPEYIIMFLFYLLAIIIIFQSFEDHNLYRNEYGVFNTQALERMLNERAGRYQYDILGFMIRNFSELREVYSRREMDSCTSQIAVYLTKKYPKLTVFYVRSGRFLIHSDKKMDMDRIHEEIRERFGHPWNTEDMEFYLEAGFVSLSVSAENNSLDIVLNALASSLKITETVPDAYLKIGAKELDSLKRQRLVKLALDTAIEQDKVEVFFQPLVDAKTRKIVGAEALARIRDENGTLISPGEFIPIAESNGQIDYVGRQVYEKTCRFLNEHKLESMGLSWVNVNVSPIQCMRRDLRDNFMSILDKYNLSPELIHLEITEESMVDYELLENQMQDMSKDGFCFVLDDYGSGYSNVSRIKRCPFINVKLDMSIVRAHCNAPDGILPALVQAFKQMNFKITAEGIETEEMADILSDIGCDFLQGYLYSKPIPLEEFLQKYSGQEQKRPLQNSHTC